MIFVNPLSAGQMSPAAQLAFARAGGMRVARNGTRRRKRAATATTYRRKRRTTRAAKRASTTRTRKARLVRGSAAAKRYMARIRKMRRR